MDDFSKKENKIKTCSTDSIGGGKKEKLLRSFMSVQMICWADVSDLDRKVKHTICRRSIIVISKKKIIEKRAKPDDSEKAMKKKGNN